MLKRSHLIPPVLALCAVAVWNISRWQGISAQEQETKILKKRIEAAQASGLANPTSATASKKLQYLIAGSNRLDWKEIYSRMAEMRESGKVDDFRTMMDLQKRLSSMTREEIMAALDEIARLNLDSAAQSELEEMLLGPLIEIDPELALETFTHRVASSDDGISWQLATAIESWAKKDRAAASAWMDRQIKAGLFESKSLDGKNPQRIAFEAALTGVLLSSDPAEAERRIAALPEDQRREAMEQISFSELGESGQKAYANLIRGLVPEDERAGSFTSVISELVPEGGYARVEQFLNDVNATPDERAVSAREAATTQMEQIAGERIVTREDVQAMRQWLDQQAPGTADRVTGEALADAAQEGGKFDFAAASSLAMEYHKASGNDDVLISFLESYDARSNLEQARPLIDMISDPKLREKILSQFE